MESFRRFTGETNEEARAYFLKAIEFDPSFARAYADVALTHAVDVQFGWVDITPEKFAVVCGYAEKALNLDDTLGQVHFSVSMLHLASKEYDKAIESSRRSITLHPNYADGYAQYALLLTYAGEPMEALEKLGLAVKLNPRPDFFYTWIEGRAHMLLGHYEQAESLFLNVIERNAHFLGAHLTLAAIYGNLGRIEDAQWEVSEILALQPDFSLGKEAQNIPFNKEGTPGFLRKRAEKSRVA